MSVKVWRAFGVVVAVVFTLAAAAPAQAQIAAGAPVGAGVPVKVGSVAPVAVAEIW